MKTNNKRMKNWLVGGMIALTLGACTKDLNRTPLVGSTSASVYADFNNYKSVLAKLYAGFAISGQTGPAGKPDISGIDEGTSNYLRQYWQWEELPTDEALITWTDAGLQDLHNLDWTADNPFVRTMYQRIYYQISLCNEFIRETTDDKLAGNNITGDNLATAHVYVAEARFLRALSYWHAMDLYGNVPFVTEKDPVGAFTPKQASRKEVYAYVESELKAIEGTLVAARGNEYARVDQACAWTLLAKLYLNASVYIGEDHSTDVITYCNKVIAAGYSINLDSVNSYKNLFLADNNTMNNEVILPITFDGLETKSYGGMNFIIHGMIGGSMPSAAFGVNGGWGGMRVTPTFVSQFTDITGATDRRAMFWTDGQSREIPNDPTKDFKQGYALTKFRNVDRAGHQGHDATGNFVDTDFPMFRLADVYLMYAEAVLRGGGGGNAATALQYVNTLRQRAYHGTSGNITAGQLTLDFILAERSRELYWEATRRTDLIRFGKQTSAAYLWAWKGGTMNGAGVKDAYNILPIPSADLIANPNLVQNDGYK
ncbi:RagB/SusD family nutrient uptake outer membrane protein [Chitinophaga parva]|uniref:RagB/SusD family nutrient uptake outer membrane protein n=1 Tax=Chitinophaga parva TaxID=2169414 RepID=A0A2T7BN74_9BACT|nr:RagB/SusD family nutrient uptake outer membrane protein [Chitinophaga parva]PUZ29071.1 RagB/SusD family nutrient uptake outer membrane protein [Chitinophaga parva]